MGYTHIEDLTDAQYKILNIIKELEKASPQQISQHPDFNIGRVMLQRHLKSLIKKDKIEKVGVPPRVYYQTKTSYFRKASKINNI